MADSDITVDSLAVTAGFGQNFLKSAFTDPHAAGLLNLALDKIEYWAATSNDRNAATLVVQGREDAIHVASDGAARYYWARARNAQGYYSDWYPASSTAGVAAAQTALIGSPGFIKLPNGMKFQWGSSTTTGGEATATFSNAVLYGIFGAYGIVSRNDGAVGPNFPNLESWSVTVKEINIVGSDWSVVFQVRKLTDAANEGNLAAAGNLNFRRAPDGTTILWLIIGG